MEMLYAGIFAINRRLARNHTPVVYRSPMKVSGPPTYTAPSRTIASRAKRGQMLDSM